MPDSQAGDAASGSNFEQRVSNLKLPPGQSYYEARRSLWLEKSASEPQPRPASIAKLETIVSDPKSVLSNKVWDNVLAPIWKGILDSGRLKHRIPLQVLIQIAWAGWMRDGTWPPGAEAPDSPTLG